MNLKTLSALIVGLMIATPSYAAAVDKAPDRKTEIYYSVAPWDGAAYLLQIPLAPGPDAPNPFIRINIWGNPRFAKPKTYKFSGTEDPGGGEGKGLGRVSYQTILDKSSPETLYGTISFKAIEQGKPVSGSYDLKSPRGKRYKGRFTAPWGNESAGLIR